MSPNFSASTLFIGTILTIGTGSCTSPSQAEVTVESAKGCENATGKKILVTYASRAGSTQEVADFIATELCKKNYRVDVQKIEKVAAISGYQSIVIGSGIRVGKWYAEASDFVKERKVELSLVPVAYFTLCMTLIDDTPEKRKEVVGYTEPIRQLLNPVAEAFFAGKMDHSKLSFFPRMMAKAVKTPQGDYRKWEEIGAWTHSLAEKLRD